MLEVGNRRIRFDPTDNKFNSAHLIAKSSDTQLAQLNFSCQHHDEILSISHDFAGNKLQLVTLVDNHETKLRAVRGSPWRSMFSQSMERFLIAPQWRGS